jgi:hypothetical protein
MQKSYAISSACFALIGVFVAAAKPADAFEDEQANSGQPIEIRLVHPDRQAATVLRLFDGAPMPHPAAALAAWKRATHDPDQLGKPLEAVISLLNPEMGREWSVFHEAQLELGFDSETGSGQWRLTIPHDDGTIAALITALRLSGGGDEKPVASGTMAVHRMGGPGAAVAARGAEGVILASSPSELDRALSPGSSGSWSRRTAPRDQQNPAANTGARESGLVFRLDPWRMTVPSRGSVATRRAIELAHGLGCRTVVGSLGICEDRLELEMASALNPVTPAAPDAAGSQIIDPEWLQWIPAGEVVALVSLAAVSGPAFWEKIFSLVDRIDRADPARAEMAPLRTRINLLATAVGVKLEVDLWPHLSGVTVGWLVTLNKPDHWGRAVLILQMDEERTARELSENILPRLMSLWGNSKHGVGLGRPPEGAHAAPRDAFAPHPLGRVRGHPLETAVRGRTVLIGWGENALQSMFQAAEHREQSTMSVIEPARTGPVQESPARFAAFWPGRIWLPIRGLDGPTLLNRCLAGGPPIVWTGWCSEGRGRDCVRWCGLHDLVRRFLAAIPIDPLNAH